MPVPANPKLSDVCAEFLVAGTTPLSAFLRGGGIVPNTAANAGVPTALPISLSQLAGATRYTNIGVTVTGDSTGYQFRAEPGAPAAVNVSTGTLTVNITGGNPGPSVTWSRISGSAAINPPAAGATTPVISASVSKNTTISAVIRCTVNDGVTSAFYDRTVSLQYEASV